MGAGRLVQDHGVAERVAAQARGLGQREGLIAPDVGEQCRRGSRCRIAGSGRQTFGMSRCRSGVEVGELEIRGRKSTIEVFADDSLDERPETLDLVES